MAHPARTMLDALFSAPTAPTPLGRHLVDLALLVVVHSALVEKILTTLPFSAMVATLTLAARIVLAPEIVNVHFSYSITVMASVATIPSTPAVVVLAPSSETWLALPLGARAVLLPISREYLAYRGQW